MPLRTQLPLVRCEEYDDKTNKGLTGVFAHDFAPEKRARKRKRGSHDVTASLTKRNQDKRDRKKKDG